MTPAALAQACSRAIFTRIASQPAPGQPGWVAHEEIATELIAGALTRSREEERASIVAWLRQRPSKRAVADRIERGEHAPTEAGS